MKKFIRQLSNNAIFRDFDENDWRELESLSLLKKKSFDKGEILFSMGENPSEIGIITEGSVVIENNDILGNSSILNKLETGDVFAETYAITGTPMMVDVVAAQSCKIVFFNVRNLLENAKNSSLAQKTTRNLLFICPAAYSALHQRQSASGWRSIFRSRSRAPEVRHLTYHSTASRWQIISILTAVRCPKNLAKCRTKG